VIPYHKSENHILTAVKTSDITIDDNKSIMKNILHAGIRKMETLFFSVLPVKNHDGGEQGPDSKRISQNTGET
jgi:hypothetical protein